ncbi:TetR/AcrR family transcriptional regulator [Paenibacillus polymyxa]|nr:TetR/AcrR family transcriptional regulator [Paenibacillus polymyxa]
MKDKITLESPKIPREGVNRRRILEAARELFIEQGVENVNMHQIAKAAGVGQATLYRRYPLKGDICLEIVSEECQPLFDEVQAYLGQSKDVIPLEQLYQVIVSYVSFLESKVPWLCAVSRVSTGHRPLHSPLCQWMRTTCRYLYNEASAKGYISDVDIVYTVEALLATLHNIDFHLKDEELSTKQILKGIRRLYIDGLKASKSG